MRSIGSRVLAAVVVTGLVTALTLSEAIASASAATAPVEGVTSDSVKVGFIYSKTGVASATSGDSDVGCKARVGRENANGGVGGRKLDVQYVDDQSSGANLTSAQNLVQNQHVFMVINDSAFAFLTYRWLLDHNVPLIGGGFDGTYYGAPGNEKVISAFGNAAPVEGVSYDVGPKIAKALGATKMASLGYGVSPSSTAAAKSNGKYAAPAAGLKSVYTNTTVDFGSTDVSPLVLGIKNSGADSAFYAMNGNTNLAIAQGLVQNGVKMKAELMATGYGQQLLDQPAREDDRTGGRLHAGLGPGRGEDQGHEAVPGRPQEVRRVHRGARLRDLHGIPRLRPGHPRAEAAGQEPEPEHVHRRPAQARSLQRRRRPRLRRHRHQRRGLRQAGPDDLHVGDAASRTASSSS